MQKGNNCIFVTIPDILGLVFSKFNSEMNLNT